ncbi:hypothetical protein [Mesorhizobium australicum]|uniref:hypothetical protein n=1 Tax=Mesorhizobium australicum TaxID=536018 RepID=UPI00333BC55F
MAGAPWVIYADAEDLLQAGEGERQSYIGDRIELRLLHGGLHELRCPGRKLVEQSPAGGKRHRTSQWAAQAHVPGRIGQQHGTGQKIQGRIGADLLPDFLIGARWRLQQ